MKEGEVAGYQVRVELLVLLRIVVNLIVVILPVLCLLFLLFLKAPRRQFPLLNPLRTSVEGVSQRPSSHLMQERTSTHTLKGGLGIAAKVGLTPDEQSAQWVECLVSLLNGVEVS